jgi:hypothetical protein
LKNEKRTLYHYRQRPPGRFSFFLSLVKKNEKAISITGWPEMSPKARLPRAGFLKLRQGGAWGQKKGRKGYGRKRKNYWRDLIEPEEVKNRS